MTIPTIQEKAYQAYWYISNRFEWVFNNLDVTMVKVNPDTKKVDDDESKNTKIEYWLETGPMVKDLIVGEVWSHDYNLDCGGDSFDQAIINLSKKLKKHYDTKRPSTPRPGKISRLPK